MERETIIYRGTKYFRYPRSRLRHKRVYFHAHAGTRLPRALHRQIWIDNFGPIPKGFHVHHRDDDSLHNEIDNLELLKPKEHTARHFDDESLAKAMSNLELARLKAPVWHKSAYGRRWHRAMAKQSWVNKQRYPKNCQVCGESYETYFPSRSRNCSTECKTKSKSLQFKNRRR